MVEREILQDWVIEALRAQGGQAVLLEVCKYIWQQHKDEIKEGGDLFYTWQYDIRWAAHILRKRGIMKAAELSPQGIWELSD